MSEIKECCKREVGNKGNKGEMGFLQGIVYGLLPHGFCIGFVVFTVIGSTLAASFFKKVLLVPYFFELLIGFSFLMAVVSAVIYLKRIDGLSFEGVKKKWKYLSILFGTTIGVNLLFFNVVFPAMANGRVIGERREIGVIKEGMKTVLLEVKIPCSGHASLIAGEIRGVRGVGDVKYISPNVFEVNYDPKQTDTVKILALEVFKSYPAVIRREG